MCDRSSVLIIFLILKILILVVLPVTLYVLYKKNHPLYKVAGVTNIFFILIFIILKLSGNACVNNSNFFYINKKANENFVSENALTHYESVRSTEQYFYQDNRNAYYYDINTVPLKDVSLSCNMKSFMEHYGAGVSAITTLISNYYDVDINIIDVLTLLEDKKLIDCDNGFDFDKVFDALGSKYNYRISKISSSQVDWYVSNGHSVLVETINKPTESNHFGCAKDYIVIYNKTREDNYNIVNPNDQYESYFCPSNTIGYSSIIEANQNEKTYTLDNINSKALRYFVIEVE